jgi:protein-arginine kinase
MTEPSMRDTFYSSIGGEGGTEVGEKRIVESFKLSNILELGEKERAIVSQIKEIMSDECDRL